MKKLLFLSLIVILASCKIDEPKQPEKFKIDLTAKVYIKADKSAMQKVRSTVPNPNHLTPLEVVKQAYMFRHYSHKRGESVVSSGWAEKDTISEIPAFIQYGAEILSVDGFNNPIIVEDFITTYDCVIVNRHLDTIGYIPNANFINAELQIRQALADKDTASVYDLFQNAFKFFPITGAEWLELKKQNQN